MSKENFISYLRTFSNYHAYMEEVNEDPTIEVEEGIKEDQVTLVFDYFMIQCAK